LTVRRIFIITTKRNMTGPDANLQKKYLGLVRV
jgi:hypothetical protein